MIKQYCLELIIKDNDLLMIESLFKSLKPDTYNTPETCNITLDLNKNEKQLYIGITCNRISDLRALFNSYYNIISTILYIWVAKI